MSSYTYLNKYQGAYQYRTWIEISKGAVQNNYKIFRNLAAGHAKILGVVKSNAYGHGLIGFSKYLQHLGIDWLGVDSISEGLKLRSCGMGIPILVLGYTMPENFKIAAKENIAITISSSENLKALSKQKSRIKIHLKIDTGMHRQGFASQDLPPILKILSANKNIIFEGLFSHFADAASPSPKIAVDKIPETAKKVFVKIQDQLRQFQQAVQFAKHINPKIIAHSANTGAALTLPQSYFDMIRIGAGLYGLWPSAELKKALLQKIDLRPALQWKSMISEIKTVGKGATVGYGYSTVLARQRRLAIIPVGYWHGYPRALSNKAEVLINGRKAKVTGNISMDMMTVDVTAIPNIAVNDGVVLIGLQKNEAISADDLAKLADTVNYEIVTRTNPLINRYLI